MADPKAPADPIDARLVRRLAAILNDTGLTEIEVERGDLRIKVARAAAAPLAVPATVYAAPAAVAAAGPASAPAAASRPEPVVEGELVRSPMVGTVYLQPEPGSAPFVRLGDMVSEGQKLPAVPAT